MIKGGYARGGRTMPRVLRLSVAYLGRDAGDPGGGILDGGPADGLVTLHEEGTGLSFRQRVTVPSETLGELLGARRELSAAAGSGPSQGRDARGRALALGRTLRAAVLGDAAARYLERVPPTACILDVDAALQPLPWELLDLGGEPLGEATPTGRLVVTPTVPSPRRAPLVDGDGDAIRILAVEWPGADAPAAAGQSLQPEASGAPELRTFERIGDWWGGSPLSVTALRGAEATRERLRDLVARETFDILHFVGSAVAGDAGHDPSGAAGGALRAAELATLPFVAPPFLVFDGVRRPLVAVGSGDDDPSALAAAALAAGAHGWLGFGWPPSDAGLACVTDTFYRALFELQNVGAAAQAARVRAGRSLDPAADATGLGFLLYGDAASAHRRDLATAA